LNVLVVDTDDDGQRGESNAGTWTAHDMSRYDACPGAVTRAKR
jgi:hypothetical protein